MDPARHEKRKQPSDDEEARRARRLKEGLGLEEEDVEVILRLRQQVVELQSRVRELQAQLDRHSRHRAIRLARYSVYYEATWREVEESEEGENATGLG